MAEARSTYHHGDLRGALVRAALEMSREQGAEAVVLREATRRAGVTPRAAYRHFADREELLRAAAQAALGDIARAIEDQQAEEQEGTGAALLRGVGLGYIRFALAEPGWFGVAFFAMGDLLSAAAPAAQGRAGRSPYELLQDALAVLVAEGRLSPERADDAAVLCWSGVHGYASLTALGPLQQLLPEVKDAQAVRLVDDLVAAVIRPSAPGDGPSR
jgi:AcrR family transcriptional regulator